MQIQVAFDEDRLLVPYTREVDYEAGGFALSESRKERLKAFYSQPTLADMAAQTAEQIAASVAPLQPAEAVAEDAADVDEPE